MKETEIIDVIRAFVEAESEKWLQSTLKTSRSAGHIFSAMWELGKPKKDGTDIDRMLHHLTYRRFSEKARLIINESQTPTEASE